MEQRIACIKMLQALVNMKYVSKIWKDYHNFKLWKTSTKSTKNILLLETFHKKNSGWVSEQEYGYVFTQ